MASKLMDLVYWRNMRWTGMVFTGLVMGLASLFQLSAITVLSHVCLGIMSVTATLRLYYKLLEVLRWNPGVHPFQSYLDYDSSLTDKETVMLVEEVVLLIAFAVTEIKRLLFIENMIDSIKSLYKGNVLAIYLIGISNFGSFFMGFYVRIRKLVRALRAFVKKIKNLFNSLYQMVRPSSAPASKPVPPASPAVKQKSKSK
uniref:Reticulon n=1 Tax=Fundulus heteroclitus TaxID=8078 RepID=A0A3Q2SP23_FUNHE